MSLLQDLYDRLLHPGTKTIVVSKGWCTPARDMILTAFQPYGVKALDLSEKEISLPIVGSNPIRIDARVIVSSKQAVWAEYLLLRSENFKLRSRPQNQRNAEWAARHNGRMPSAWDEAQGKWRDSKCKKGRNR